MIILKPEKKNIKGVIEIAVRALRQGKTVVFPTDTSYGLAVDATNEVAVRKLFRLKGRSFKKPVHVVVPSVAAGKRLVRWNAAAETLVRNFWPGAVTLVLPLRTTDASIHKLAAKSGFLGLRMPASDIALGLSKQLRLPITATSSNISGMPDCYSAAEVIEQFINQKNKPDIIIDIGPLPRRKPSTVIKIADGIWEILRQGPVSKKQIEKVLNTNVLQV